VSNAPCATTPNFFSAIIPPMKMNYVHRRPPRARQGLAEPKSCPAAFALAAASRSAPAIWRSSSLPVHPRKPNSSHLYPFHCALCRRKSLISRISKFFIRMANVPWRPYLPNIHNSLSRSCLASISSPIASIVIRKSKIPKSLISRFSEFSPPLTGLKHPRNPNL